MHHTYADWSHRGACSPAQLFRKPRLRDYARFLSWVSLCIASACCWVGRSRPRNSAQRVQVVVAAPTRSEADGSAFTRSLEERDPLAMGKQPVPGRCAYLT